MPSTSAAVNVNVGIGAQPTFSSPTADLNALKCQAPPITDKDLWLLMRLSHVAPPKSNVVPFLFSKQLFYLLTIAVEKDNVAARVSQFS